MRIQCSYSALTVLIQFGLSFRCFGFYYMPKSSAVRTAEPLGSITSRFSGKEPALLPRGTQTRHERVAEIELISVHSFTGWRRKYKRHMQIIIQPLAKTGNLISSKENFQSTQLYDQVHRFIISWNGRCFDSVGCLHLLCSGYTRSYGQLSK